ncbi:MAG: NAD(+)/NADH kinase [Candidatus Velthaea sp.]
MQPRSARSVLAGIVANPASGRDIRRLTSAASVFPTAEKAQMVQRLLGAFGRFGVERVLMMPDRTGISSLVVRALATHANERDGRWPEVGFVDIPVTDSPRDTHRAVQAMCAAGVSLIAVLGGDGTHRAVAKHCGDVPLLTLSTGTNNVFPDLREATVAGIAGALVATGAVPPAAGLFRNKMLRVRGAGPRATHDDIALVDVCVSNAANIGSRALWRAVDLRELYVAFAEEDAIGLSSLVAHWAPVGRSEPRGYALRFACGGDACAAAEVSAPIAPGLIADVPVSAGYELVAGRTYRVSSGTGTLALDGEREIECSADDRFTIELDLAGPRTVDVPSALRYAAQHRLTTTFPPALAAAAR